MSDADRPEKGPAATEASASVPAPSRIHFELPEGWLGVLLLLLVAALSGGLIATYWPVFLGGGDIGTTHERLTTLETRVDQMATGKAGAAASGVFDDLRRDIAGLGQRLDADEARLTAIEKTAEQGGKPGDNTDLAALHQKMDAASTGLADITARLAKLEGSPHGGGGADLSAINAKLGTLDARVTALETDIARSAQTVNGTISGLDSRLKALETSLPPDLTQRLESFALKSDETDLDARLKTLEAENSGESLHRAATMLALARLAHAAAEPGSFALELDSFAITAPGDPAIATLQSYAAKGAATEATLAQRFPAVARVALDAEWNAQGGGFFARLWANIVGLVSIRRVGEGMGNDSESRLGRAQARLDVGDLAAAAAEVRALKGPAASATADWLKDADARLALDHAVSEMNARVIQALAVSPQTPASTQAPAAPPQQGLAPSQGGKK